jgi:hypothetical protein
MAILLVVRRSIIGHHTKIHRKPRLMATNLQGSSHRPRAVGGAYETERIIFMKREGERRWQDGERI